MWTVENSNGLKVTLISNSPLPGITPKTNNYENHHNRVIVVSTVLSSHTISIYIDTFTY